MAERRTIVVAGTGSVGQRHARNLLALGWDDVTLYRTGRGTLELDEGLAGAPQVNTLEEAVGLTPKAVIVANPTALHLSVATAAAQAGSDLLIEKPVAHVTEGLNALRAAVARADVRVLVGFQFRFHPGLCRVAEWVRDGAIGEVVTGRARWGEYLPSWHPWEPYREGYSARTDLGGGVLLTLSHPFDYVRWILGEVTAVQAMVSDLHPLGLDVEEAALVHLRTERGAVVEVSLDFHERPGTHALTLVGTGGSIDWDAATGETRLRRPDAEAEVFAPPPGFERNTMFVDELAHFLRCLERTEEPRCTLDDGVRALEIALAAKRSAQEGRRIDV